MNSGLYFLVVFLSALNYLRGSYMLTKKHISLRDFPFFSWPLLGCLIHKVYVEISPLTW